MAENKSDWPYETGAEPARFVASANDNPEHVGPTPHLS